MKITACIFTFAFLVCTFFAIPVRLSYAKDMNKTLLLIHGWPRPVDIDSLYYKFFNDWGYDIIAPEIFTKDFVLTQSEAKNYIEKELNGKTPDVIMGISLGGLLAPYIAKDYPQARMILIATGPKLEPKAIGFKLLVDMAKNKKFLNALNVVKFIPQKYLFSFYEAINPFSGNSNERTIYMDDMKKNFKYIMAIPISEEGEVVDFITNTDNTELLKTIKNKTLIFSGENDLLMPSNLSDDLHNLLSGSQVIINHGSHFDIIAEPSFEEMEKFLSE